MNHIVLNIDFSESKKAEVLQILDSLVRLGAINSYSKPKNLIAEGNNVSDDEMLQFLKKSEEQIEQGLSFTTTEAKAIFDDKTELVKDIHEAVENLNLVKQGNLRVRPAKELLNEL